jgi:hypothetical protein
MHGEKWGSELRIAIQTAAYATASGTYVAFKGKGGRAALGGRWGDGRAGAVVWTVGAEGDRREA